MPHVTNTYTRINKGMTKFFRRETDKGYNKAFTEKGIYMILKFNFTYNKRQIRADTPFFNY